MGNLLTERLKIDTAIVSQALNGAGTSVYYNMKKYRKALFITEIGAMAAAATSAMQVMEALNAAAGGAQVLTGLTATMTANVGVAEATLTLLNVANLDLITINGLVFTAHTDTTTLADREYDISGTDTQDAAELVLCINDAVYGVPGVTATSAAAVVTLVATEPGEANLTFAAIAATITVATIRAIGYVEVDHSMMTKAIGGVAAFTHLALRVTNSGAMQTGAVLVRGNNRYTPVQYVAGADVAP